MITITLLEKIEALIPGPDAESVLRRRVVRLLADAGGQLSLDALHAALGPSGRVVLAIMRVWEGFFWPRPKVLGLAPWLRHKLDLPDDREHPLAALEDLPETQALLAAREPAPIDATGVDPLARVRALVARAKNVATVREALAWAYVSDRYGIAS